MNSKKKMFVGDSLWQVLSDSLLNAARGYNPEGSMAGDHILEDGKYGPRRVMGMGSNPLGGAVADMMYQALSGKDYTQYDAARTAFMNPDIGYGSWGNPFGHTRINPPENMRPAHRGAAVPANINAIVSLISQMGSNPITMEEHNKIMDNYFRKNDPNYYEGETLFKKGE